MSLEAWLLGGFVVLAIVVAHWLGKDPGGRV